MKTVLNNNTTSIKCILRTSSQRKGASGRTIKTKCEIKTKKLGQA